MKKLRCSSFPLRKSLIFETQCPSELWHLLFTMTDSLISPHEHDQGGRGGGYRIGDTRNSKSRVVLDPLHLRPRGHSSSVIGRRVPVGWKRKDTLQFHRIVNVTHLLESIRQCFKLKIETVTTVLVPDWVSTRPSWTDPSLARLENVHNPRRW